MQIERRRFTETLSSGGGRLDLNRISPRLRSELADAGVDATRLQAIAGHDSVIRGAEFNALYDALQARSTSASGPSSGPGGGDLGRSERLYGLLTRETQHDPAPGEPGASEPRGRASAGLRGALGNERRTSAADAEDLHRSAGGAHLSTTYAAPLTPELNPTQAAPERPNWFIQILEALFSWIPGVTTDQGRLQAYGRDLADRQGSDVTAFRDAYIAQRSRETISNGLPPTQPQMQAEARDLLVDRLAARMETQGLSPETARERAGVAVDAMLARIDERREADGARAGALGLPAPTFPEARLAASLAVPAQASARELGGAWPDRMRLAMIPPPATHPLVASQPTPERQERMRAFLVSEQVRTVAYAMALERSGQLHAPREALDGLLSAERGQLVGSTAAAGALSALSRLPEAQRTALVRDLQAVPADRRDFAYAALAREHVGLGSSSDAERAGALARVRSAATQLQGMTPAEADRALRRGTLGLDGPQTIHLSYPSGRSLDVPMYFHPTLTPAEREQQVGLVREAYGHIPEAIMRHVIAAEGGEDFNVQALPNGSLNSGLFEPELPNGLADTGAFYRTQDNEIRLNTSVFADIMRTDPAHGRDRVIGMILHETTHDLDDLAHSDQDRGFFVGPTDPAADRARTSGTGDLAGAWAHYQAVRQRFTELSTDVGASRDATRYYALGRNSHRTPAQDLEYAELGRTLAARAGTVSPYAADPGLTQRGGQLGEWWAETYSSFLNPATRDRLRQSDPVAYQAAQRYTQLMEGGMPPTEALRDALRFSLSSQMAAQEGRAIVSSAPRGGPLSEPQLRDLEAIGVGFQQHAEALRGWTPFQNNAGLRDMRRSEAQGAVTEGRQFLDAIAARRAELESRGQGGGAEAQRLDRLATSLTPSVTALEREVARLGGARS